MKNIVLIGMMGCGKSTCARRLARQLGREMADTDGLITAREGRPITELFAAQGEEYFRALEEETARALSRRTGLIVACGGGLPTREAAMAPLKETGLVVFLRRDPGETYDSVGLGDRPLAQGGRADFLSRFAQREPIYRRWADLVVTDFSAPQATVNAILEGLQ